MDSLSHEPEPPVLQAGRFIRQLFGPYEDGFLEIRLLRGRAPEQVFEPLPIDGPRLKELATALVEKAKDGYDVYCGVLPRMEASGKASSIRRAATVWVDLDYKNSSREEIEAATADADMAVMSGGGVHGYWWTTEVLDLDSKQARDTFSAVVQDHQQGVSGGKADSTHDLPRILRVPGTLNWKDRSDPKPVTLLWAVKRPAIVPKEALRPSATPEPEDEDWKGLTMLWDECVDWIRAMDAAKKGRFPNLHPPVRVPSRRIVGDANTFLLGEFARCAHYHDDPEVLHQAEADVDFLLAHFKENGVAY